MGKPKDSGRIDLHQIFLRTQHQLLANLSAADVFEHPTANGTAAEHHWLTFLNRYLPQRYRATSAFVLDCRGNRSRQIDIAIYDHFYSPLLFPDDAGPHIPAESVYAVFEVKPTFSRQWLRDAAEKAASVRALYRTSVTVPNRRRTKPSPILSGLLAANSVWTPETFSQNLSRALKSHPLDLGCCLNHGSFSANQINTDHPLFHFLFTLLARLRTQGTAPAPNWSAYLVGQARGPRRAPSPPTK